MNTAYKQLEDFVLPQMEAYQTDVTEHDKREIESSPGVPFIHVTRDATSTHLFFKPNSVWLERNAPQVYLFGRSTPQEIHADNLSLLQKYFTDADVFHVSNGVTVKPCTYAKAVKTFKEFTT
jgi:hypothetical protein